MPEEEQAVPKSIIVVQRRDPHLREVYQHLCDRVIRGENLELSETALNLDSSESLD